MSERRLENLESFETAVQEEMSPDGLALLIHKKKLYHGSSKPGIENFLVAENDTVGQGVYLTDQESAERYAGARASEAKGEPVVYETVVENLRIADMRVSEILKLSLNAFRQRLDKILAEKDLKWYREHAAKMALEQIESEMINVGNLRDAVFNFTKEFTEVLQELGYDGLIAIEGGEHAMQQRKDHFTYLIFDPKKVIIQNTRILR